MKIDKTLRDLFSPQGSKNNQPASGAAAEKMASADTKTAVEPEIQAAEANTESAAKLSGAEEAEVKSFVKSVNGTPEEKMAVLRMAQKKGVAITKDNLTAMHYAMNDKNPVETIEHGLQGAQILNEGTVEADRIMARLERLLEKVEGVTLERTQSGMVQLIISGNGGDSAESGIEGEETQNGEMTFLLDKFTAKELLAIMAAVIKGNLSEKEASKLLSGKSTGAETSITLTMEQSMSIKATLTSALSQLDVPKMSKDAPEKELTQLVKEAHVEIEVQTTFELSATEVAEEDEAFVNDEKPSFAVTEELLQGLEQSIAAMVEGLQNNQGAVDLITQSGVRQVLRVEVTQKMVEAKEAFTNLKKDLGAMMQKFETPTPVEDQKRVLKTVVEKLDNFIMKSDVMMYTSMKNERDLLKTSSTLQDALKLIGKGKMEDAFSLAKKAMADLDRMVFKPSAKRVEAHLVGKLNDWREGALQEDHPGLDAGGVRKPLYLKGLEQSEGSSGRMLMEVMRKLGLNHEFEKSEMLLQSGFKKEMDGDARLDDNVKATLMKMAEDNKDKPGVEPVQKALETLLGVQLMNRHEVGKDEQSMMFVVPWGQQQDQTVKVMVNGRKNGGVMSWENCSLYFSFDTKRLGQTGIRVTISDKTVGMAVFNDRENGKQVLEGYLDKLYQGFVEIGFQKGNVTYSKLGLDRAGTTQATTSTTATAPQSTQATQNDKPMDDVAQRGFELKI